MLSNILISVALLCYHMEWAESAKGWKCANSTKLRCLPSSPKPDGKRKEMTSSPCYSKLFILYPVPFKPLYYHLSYTLEYVRKPSRYSKNKKSLKYSRCWQHHHNIPFLKNHKDIKQQLNTDTSEQHHPYI